MDGIGGRPVVVAVCRGFGGRERRVDDGYRPVAPWERWNFLLGDRQILMGNWSPWCLCRLIRFVAREVLLEAPPPVVKLHGKNVLTGAQSPQEVGAKPVLLIEDPERKERGKQPTPCDVEVVYSQEDTNQFSPFL